MRVEQVKGNDMKKEVLFSQELGLNMNTENGSNVSRNSLNSDGTYTDGSFITASGQLLITVNGQNYLIDVEKL